MAPERFFRPKLAESAKSAPELIEVGVTAPANAKPPRGRIAGQGPAEVHDRV